MCVCEPHKCEFSVLVVLVFLFCCFSPWILSCYEVLIVGHKILLFWCFKSSQLWNYFLSQSFVSQCLYGANWLPNEIYSLLCILCAQITLHLFLTACAEVDILISVWGQGNLKICTVLLFHYWMLSDLVVALLFRVISPWKRMYFIKVIKGISVHFLPRWSGNLITSTVEEMWQFMKLVDGGAMKH